VDNLFQRLGPHVRNLHTERPEQNKWMHWAKLQKQPLDTLESWLGGLVLLRDRQCLEWIKPGEDITCKVYERFPQMRSQAETAWARYGPGSVQSQPSGISRVSA